MKKIFTLSICTIFLITGIFAQTANRTNVAFTVGNLVVYRVGTGTGSLLNTGAAVFLDEYTPTGTLVQSIELPTSTGGGNAALIASGTATSEGLLTRSSNGQFLIATGYNSTIPAASSLSGTTSVNVPRTIARINNAGVINSSTSLTDYASANNPRSATSVDGTAFWAVGGTGGVVYATLGSTTVTNSVCTTPANIRDVRIYNDQLYFSSGSGTVRLATVGTGVPNTTGQTATVIPGFPTAGSPYGFYFTDLDATVPGLDVLYVADDNSTSGGIQKYSLVGGTWVLNGVIGAGADSYRGLVGSATGSTVVLFSTRKGGSAAAGGGELVNVIDATGYNVAPAATPTLLATAAANTAFRGVAFAPTVNPLPLNLVSFNAGWEDKNVKIWWSTSNEINTKEFVIERSNDAANFITVGKVNANNQLTNNNYSYIDNNPSADKSYYRLKMVDKDGKYTYSNLIALKSGKIQTLGIYPNPAITTIVVSHEKAKSNSSIVIMSGDGKRVFVQNIQAGSSFSNVNISKLATGTYFVVATIDNEKSTSKFVKY